MHSDHDPIVAIATAPGRGGIGIVRVSGSRLDGIVNGVLGQEQARRLVPRRALYAGFLDAAGQTIDAGLALLFPAPNSYTGESVLELQGHGGPVVLRMLLNRCLEAGASMGARIAEPGEFTRRAFLNDRLDLAQAEAVADVIEAGTAAAARGAMRSLQGAFSQAAKELAQDLGELRARIEATLDFPEEEIDFLQASDVGARLQGASARLAEVEQRAQQGAILRQGLQVVLVGAPNVGKSSLLNALAGEEVAIVTEHPGTTRDRIERNIEIDGVACNIVDTAGLRDTRDPIESIGMEHTRAAASNADLALLVRDDVAPADEPLVQAAGAMAARRLVVHNKIDCSGAAAGSRAGRVFVSARTGAGLAELRAEILRVAGWHPEAGAETVFVARERHLQALALAGSHLRAAREQASEGTGRLDLFAEELRLAAAALGEITGTVSSDELLGQIFQRFCIGK